MNLEEYIGPFFTSLRSVHTQRAYRADLDAFFYSGTGVPSNARQACAVRALHSYLFKAGVMSYNPAFIPSPVTRPDFETLLGALNIQCEAGRLYHALFSTVGHLGLSSKELRALKAAHLNFRERTLCVEGRGCIPVPDALMVSLMRYMSMRAGPEGDEAHLFTATGTDGRRSLSHEAITKALQRAVSRAGITTPVSPHTLRGAGILPHAK